MGVRRFVTRVTPVTGVMCVQLKRKRWASAVASEYCTQTALRRYFSKWIGVLEASKVREGERRAPRNASASVAAQQQRRNSQASLLESRTQPRRSRASSYDRNSEPERVQRVAAKFAMK